MNNNILNELMNIQHVNVKLVNIDRFVSLARTLKQ